MKDTPTPFGANGSEQNAKRPEVPDASEAHSVVRLVVGPWAKAPATAAMNAGRVAEQRDEQVRRAREINQLLALKGREEEFETELIGTPAITWFDASERARYLIGLLLATSAARTPRRKKLIAKVLEDLRRLSVAEVEVEQ